MHGHTVAVDGPVTKAAVQAFQTGAGLTSDSIVGNSTWPKLIVTVTAGASGARVRAVQGQLHAQGWRLPVDGIFGPVTTRSIRDYQTAHHLTVDGTVGDVTWHFLVAGFVHLNSAALASSHPTTHGEPEIERRHFAMPPKPPSIW
jgi:murein L,D-transpeptidase YcbB/YkuD